MRKFLGQPGKSTVNYFTQEFQAQFCQAELTKTLWCRTVGQGCGAGLWCGTVGRDCGAGLWGRAVGRDCGAGLWCGIVGRDCGSGHCCLPTSVSSEKQYLLYFVLSLSPVGSSILIITQMLTFGCSSYLLPYSFSILTILTHHHIVAF